MVAVASTLTHSVTCGAVNALWVTACAVARRTPRTGMRVSVAPARAGVGAAMVLGRGGCGGERGERLDVGAADRSVRT